jgi:hypothetical protein
MLRLGSAVGLAIGLAIRGGAPSEQRNFTTFDPVLQTYMQMQTPKTFVGDFEFYFDAAVASEDSYFGALSKTTSVSDDFFRFISTTGGNGIQTFLGGEYLNITGLNYKDGKIRRFGYRRTAKLLELIVNGVVVVARTQSGAVLPVSIGFIGRAGYFNGVIANVTLTDLTTPSNSESWKLDRPIGTNTEQSSSGNSLLTYVNATKREEFTKVGNDWLGAERIKQPINVLLDWLPSTFASNLGVNTWDTTNVGGIFTGAIGNSGDRMRLAYSVSADAREILIKDSTNGQGADPTLATIAANTTGVGVVDYTATLQGVYLRIGGSSNGNTLNSMSLKRILEVA